MTLHGGLHEESGFEFNENMRAGVDQAGEAFAGDVAHSVHAEEFYICLLALEVLQTGIGHFRCKRYVEKVDMGLARRDFAHNVIGDCILAPTQLNLLEERVLV